METDIIEARLRALVGKRVTVVHPFKGRTTGELDAGRVVYSVSEATGLTAGVTRIFWASQVSEVSIGYGDNPPHIYLT